MTREKQEKDKTHKIFKEIKHLSIGTYKHSYGSDKSTDVIKQYVPMFPDLYLDKQHSDYTRMQNFECNFYHKDEKVINGMRVPTSI